MMEAYPKDSNEYKYAEASLNISHLKLNHRDPNAQPESGPEGTFTIETLADGSTRHVASVPEPGKVASAPPERSAP